MVILGGYTEIGEYYRFDIIPQHWMIHYQWRNTLTGKTPVTFGRGTVYARIIMCTDIDIEEIING